MAHIGRGRIALIDDDPALVSLLQDLLGSTEGHEVAVCMEGVRAYEFIKAYRPDLVLLDLRMGGAVVGWTILEQLTRDPETRPIPIIVCSAAIRELQESEPLLRRDGVATLPKPFDLDALLETVDAGLASGHAEREPGGLEPAEG